MSAVSELRNTRVKELFLYIQHSEDIHLFERFVNLVFDLFGETIEEVRVRLGFKDVSGVVMSRLKSISSLHSIEIDILGGRLLLYKGKERLIFVINSALTPSLPNGHLPGSSIWRRKILLMA